MQISKLLVFLFLLVMIVLLIFYMKKDTFISMKMNNENDSNCVCVFDLDDTITCGLDIASQAISKCKNMSCKIAINTARPVKWYSDIKLDELGLTSEEIDSNIYHGEPFKCSFMDTKCMQESIAQTKVKHLRTIASKFDTIPKRVILFDDQRLNIDKAKENGFSGILANHFVCGLPNNTIQQIDDILS
jgi:hypothetical protein